MAPDVRDDDALQAAVARLRAGGLVAFPTETVYGLGADATNAAAVAAIFRAKGRPADHPVIVHLPDATHIGQWAASVPPLALRLAARFWPGPLTLIVPRHARVLDMVTGGQRCVGLRVPSHPMAHALLAAFGGGIAAPSANRFGRISPTTAAHVRAELGDTVAMILDGGACPVGIESTILDLSEAHPRLLRPGMISVAALAEVIGAWPEGVAEKPVVRASGMLATHYAPVTPLQLLPRAQLSTAVAAISGRCAVLATAPCPITESVFWQEMPPQPEAYAHVLYDRLRLADAAGCVRIFVESPPQTAAWLAIYDRLHRATAATVTAAFPAAS